MLSGEGRVRLAGPPQSARAAGTKAPTGRRKEQKRISRQSSELEVQGHVAGRAGFW